MQRFPYSHMGWKRGVTQVKGPHGQKTCRTVFLASSAISFGVRGTSVLLFTMVTSALHRPSFFAMVGPTLVASTWVRGRERVHSETYASSSHWLTL